MAGIYDRILPSAEDRIPVHILYGAVVTYAEGIFTKAQIRTAINDVIVAPLTTA